MFTFEITNEHIVNKLMDNYLEKIEKIREEINKWLFPGDKRQFAKDWGIHRATITRLLNGSYLGTEGVDRLLTMHKKAMENKRKIESTYTEQAES